MRERQTILQPRKAQGPIKAGKRAIPRRLDSRQLIAGLHRPVGDHEEKGPARHTEGAAQHVGRLAAGVVCWPPVESGAGREAREHGQLPERR